MIGKMSKKLIIVCDEKTEPYANYLRQLISTNDDKEEDVVGVADGTVDAAVWLEKEYVANKAQISSSEHILFVGDNKVSTAETSSMILKYEKYGMKYGWLGKRGMMRVDDTPTTPEAYDEFVEYCLGYQTEFEKVAMSRPANEIEEKESFVQETTDNTKGVGLITKRALAGLKAGFKTVTSPVIDISNTGIQAISNISVRKKILDQQYRALAVILYIDGLQSFLEG